MEKICLLAIGNMYEYYVSNKGLPTLPAIENMYYVSYAGDMHAWAAIGNINCVMYFCCTYIGAELLWKLICLVLIDFLTNKYK